MKVNTYKLSCAVEIHHVDGLPEDKQTEFVLASEAKLMAHRIHQLESALENVLNVTSCDCGEDIDMKMFCSYCIAESALHKL